MCCFLANGAGSLATIRASCNFILNTGLGYKCTAVGSAAVCSLAGLGIVLGLLVHISCHELVVKQRLHIVEEDLVVTAFGWV
jgi:hypothetical protein